MGRGRIYRRNPQCQRNKSEGSAERLRMLVEQSSLTEYGPLHVTISIGGAPVEAEIRLKPS